MASLPRSRTALPLALVAVVALLAAGCTRDQIAEQHGRDAGEALCDIHDADDEAEAQAARDDLEAQLADLSDDYATFTAEDRADVRENVDDLIEHLADGDDLLVQQDLAVIRRNLASIDGDMDDAAQAAIDGVLQGLDDCR